MRMALNTPYVKTLCINSLAPSSPNLQQPDMWTRSKRPLYFPQHAPSTQSPPRPRSPILTSNTISLGEPEQDSTSGQAIVLGSRLSLEDFMSLKNFCLELFLQ
eukprot:gene26601-34347_t